MLYYGNRSKLIFYLVLLYGLRLHCCPYIWYIVQCTLASGMGIRVMTNYIRNCLYDCVWMCGCEERR